MQTSLLHSLCVMALAIIASAGMAQTKVLPSADTWVRLNNTAKHGSEEVIEIHTSSSSGNDFVGLMSFNIPDNFDVSQLQNATLRLVTERCKGATVAEVYAYGHLVDENTTYADEVDYISAARHTTPVEFRIKFGVRSKALGIDDISANPDLNVWTDSVDITSLVKAVGGRQLNLMIACPDDNKNANKFYAKEVKDVVNAKNSSYTYASADLVPQLILTSNTSAGISDFRSITATVADDDKVYTLSGVRVSSANLPRGVYIRHHKKFVVK